MKATSCSFEIPIQFCMRFLNMHPDIAASSPFSGFSTAKHRLVHHSTATGLAEVSRCVHIHGPLSFSSAISRQHTQRVTAPTFLPCSSTTLRRLVSHSSFSFFSAIASYTFLGGAVERNLPASAGDIGSFPES